MTKAQLAQRVAELEASQTPRMPAHIVAHQAGANARAKAIDLGRPDIVVASAKAYLSALNKLHSDAPRVNPQHDHAP